MLPSNYNIIYDYKYFLYRSMTTIFVVHGTLK